MQHVPFFRSLQNRSRHFMSLQPDTRTSRVDSEPSDSPASFSLPSGFQIANSSRFTDRRTVNSHYFMRLICTRERERQTSLTAIQLAVSLVVDRRGESSLFAKYSVACNFFFCSQGRMCAMIFSNNRTAFGICFFFSPRSPRAFERRLCSSSGRVVYCKCSFCQQPTPLAD